MGRVDTWKSRWTFIINFMLVTVTKDGFQAINCMFLENHVSTHEVFIRVAKPFGPPHRFKRPPTGNLRGLNATTK